jgi:hypothetical protein
LALEANAPPGNPARPALIAKDRQRVLATIKLLLARRSSNVRCS